MRRVLEDRREFAGRCRALGGILRQQSRDRVDDDVGE